jgi:phosphate transport system substrate-binding protein
MPDGMLPAAWATSARTVRLVCIAACALLTSASAMAQEITGAGATFPAPIYTRWGEDYAKASGVKLNYQAVGSGAGVTQIINRTVDFGASDAPVATERLTKEKLLQFPAVIGAVVLVANVPGVDVDKLTLSGDVLGEIYLGQVRLWNDPRIAALNPGLKLPKAPIAPAYRADSSGTTSIFTKYLSSANKAFETKVGAGNSVAWKTGLGAPGNAGVAAAVKNTKGGLGYVEYAYAIENKMPMPALVNASGKAVKPTEPGFAAAALRADWARAENLAASMINLPGDTTWPIVSASYVLIPKAPANPKRAAEALKFFDWAFRNGEPAATRLHYVALPAAVHDEVRKSWSAVRAGVTPVWPAG